MECLVLAPTALIRAAMRDQLENLGEDWRCIPVQQAAQARQVLDTHWVNAAILFDDPEASRLLTDLTEHPLLAPPYVLGVGLETPDGPLPDIDALPRGLRSWWLSGQLPRLSACHLPQAERLARGMMQAVGVPQNLRAWVFLPDMLALTVVHPPLLSDLQHGLYPLIGRRHGLTAGAVERRLRLCVEATWSRSSLTALERFFGHSVDPERGKPTNREFLCRVQERLTISMTRLQR